MQEINLGNHTRFIGEEISHLGRLAEKMSSVFGEVDYVQKSGRNDHHGYTYVTERDLTEKIRGPLVEHGIMLFTSVEEKEQQGSLTRVVTEHSFIDTETGATLVIQGRGQGQDKQDKGVYKAVTGAVKYMLYKTFLIPAGDDPEKPPTIDRGRLNKLVSSAKKWGVSKGQLQEAVQNQMGISSLGQIHPDQAGTVWGLVQSIGTHPDKQEEDSSSNSTTTNGKANEKTAKAQPSE